MKDDQLPYEYIDEDESPKKKKKKSKADDAPTKEYRRASEKRASGAKKTAKRDEITEETGIYEPARKKAQSGKKKSASGKKKKKGSALPAALAVLLILVLLAAAAFLADWRGVVDLGGFSSKLIALVSPAPTKAPNTDNQYDDLGSLFSDLTDDGPADGLSEKDGNSVRVEDLALTQGLDDKWLNVLLLGADLRVPGEPCRTDTMMICSVNRETGEIKLTSIMRDTAVQIKGRTVRINSAYFFGGAELAMRTVNQYFGMNIQYYAFVDFAGFAAIAEKLGGVEMNITEGEMGQINHNVKEQYWLQVKHKRMEYAAAEAEYYATELKTYGTNVHLNGMQTLGYARIRKLDSDYERARRQRKVLNTLLVKMKGTSLSNIMILVSSSLDSFQTNLNLNTIVELGALVLNREGFEGAEEMRLPKQGTYKEERRNDEAMLYDMDVEENTKELHQFIYGK
ncbi:MAG: LCP family protein [Clostridia bacterium]|nr:LCP family protein [Clostridia bacterium]